MNPFDNLLDRLICLEARGKTSFVSKYPALADIPSRIEDYNKQLVQQKMGVKDDSNIKTSGLTYKVLMVVSRLLYQADIISDEEMSAFRSQYGIAPKIRFLDSLIQKYNANLQPGQPGKENLDNLIASGDLDNIIGYTFGTKKETTMAGEVTRAEQIQATKDAVTQVFDEITPGEEESLLTRTMFATVLGFIENDDELIEDIANDANTSMPEVRKIIDMLRGRSAKINNVEDIVKLNRKLVAIPGMQKIAAMIKGSVIDVIPSEIERVQSLGTDDEIDDTEEVEPEDIIPSTKFSVEDFKKRAADRLAARLANRSTGIKPEDQPADVNIKNIVAPSSDVQAARDEFRKKAQERIEARRKMRETETYTESKYISFKEKYKPKTSWQLDELRSYGL